MIPGSGRSLGEANGNPLQYSSLGNFLDREAWRAAVRGVTKSQTGLSNQTTTMNLFLRIDSSPPSAICLREMRHRFYFFPECDVSISEMTGLPHTCQIPLGFCNDSHWEYGSGRTHCSQELSKAGSPLTECSPTSGLKYLDASSVPCARSRKIWTSNIMSFAIN